MIEKQKLFNRRIFLLYCFALATVTAIVLKQIKLQLQKNQAFKSDHESDKDFLALGMASLGERASAKGLLYGAFPQADYKTFSEDLDFQSRMTKECDLLISGFYWNWDGIRPSATTYDFTKTDYFAKFALANKMLFRGHPLVWYRTTPDWLLEKFNNPNTTSQEIQDILTDHITQVVSRYAGKVHSWDVVNEAINIEDARTDGFRDTSISGINDVKSRSWLDFLGTDYVELAFQTAAKADPQAILTYNEFGLDYDLPEEEAKRTATLKLLEKLRAKGTPINAFGMQAHLDATKNSRFKPQKLRQFLQNVADLDLKIIISELDVRDRFFKGDIISRDRAVAQAYYDYLSVVLESPAVIAVSTWGLSDRYSWTSNKPRPDGTPQRPLPLDSQLNRKQAWHAIAMAFDNAPQR